MIGTWRQGLQSSVEAFCLLDCVEATHSSVVEAFVFYSFFSFVFSVLFAFCDGLSDELTFGGTKPPHGG